MSSGYASRLSEYENKGECCLPEFKDSVRVLTVKMRKLTELVQSASQVVVITGAGISTSAGIPDFRGPKGVWTKEKMKSQNQINNDNPLKRKLNENGEVRELDNFIDAKPTICHRAITKLVSEGIITFCVTQNVDGLHLASGLSRGKYAAMHGCVRTERCENHSCQAEFFRDFDVGGMSFAPTGRRCSLCNGVLRDTLLDWEDPLPEDDLAKATAEIEKPGTLVLCLGTSLRIEPVGLLPLSAEKYVIVNLQKTPRDNEAELIIRAPVDEVMSQLVTLLGFPKWQSEEPPPIERVWQPPHIKKNRKKSKK